MRIRIEIEADSAGEARAAMQDLMGSYRVYTDVTVKGLDENGEPVAETVAVPQSELDRTEREALRAEIEKLADKVVDLEDAAVIGDDGKPPRKRRTKAEMEAARAAEAAKAERPPMSAAEAANVMAKDAVPDEKRVLPPAAEAKLRQELQNAVLEGEVGDAETLPTEDDVRLAMQKLSALKDVNATRQLMADFGIARASALPPERRREFIETATERWKK